MDGGWDGLILTTCCDSIRRLYDVLKAACPDKFIYLLDLPRKVNDFTAGLYAKRFGEMLEAYARLFRARPWRRTPSPPCWSRSGKKPPSPRPGGGTAPGEGGHPGRPLPQGVRDLLRECGGQVVFDLTCTGLDRNFPLSGGDALTAYAHALMNQFPCMRMADAVNRGPATGSRWRARWTASSTTRCNSAITSLTSTPPEGGRLRPSVRVGDRLHPARGGPDPHPAAGLFRVHWRQPAREASHRGSLLHKKEGKPVYILGIDSGSTSTNAAILDEKKNLIAFSVVRTAPRAARAPSAILEEVLQKANLTRRTCPPSSPPATAG